MTGLVILICSASLLCLAFALSVLAWRTPVDDDAGLSILEPRDGLTDLMVAVHNQQWDSLDELQYRRATRGQP